MEPEKEKDRNRSANVDTFTTRIIIEPNGDVLIENLSAELLDLAAALNPEDENVSSREQTRLGQESSQADHKDEE